MFRSLSATVVCDWSTQGNDGKPDVANNRSLLRSENGNARDSNLHPLWSCSAILDGRVTSITRHRLSIMSRTAACGPRLDKSEREYAMVASLWLGTRCVGHKVPMRQWSLARSVRQAGVLKQARHADQSGPWIAHPSRFYHPRDSDQPPRMTERPPITAPWPCTSPRTEHDFHLWCSPSPPCNCAQALAQCPGTVAVVPSGWWPVARRVADVVLATWAPGVHSERHLSLQPPIEPGNPEPNIGWASNAPITQAPRLPGLTQRTVAGKLDGCDAHINDLQCRRGHVAIRRGLVRSRRTHSLVHSYIHSFSPSTALPYHSM